MDAYFCSVLLKSDVHVGFQDVDVAIVKATTHDEALPKEKHIKSKS